MRTDTVYEGDCVEILAQFPKNSIDCVVTSPPYDNLRTYPAAMRVFNKVN